MSRWQWLFLSGMGAVTLIGAEIANFRVEVAHSYVNTAALREVENRLEAAVDKLGDRLDRSIENLLNLLRSDAISRAKAQGHQD